MTTPTDPSTPTAKTSSGIITDSSGNRHIPPSTRADGSQRKEIRIRPGYRPPEDVEVYKNRTAAAFKSRGTGGIPGSEGLKDSSNEAGAKEGNKSSNKNAKRREARKKAKAAGEEEGADTGTIREEKEDVQSIADPAVEKEKQAKRLKKKLREARELQEKKEKGEGLLHEQFEKVIKINELIRDLDKLGFDANGEPKAKDKAEGKDKTA